MKNPLLALFSILFSVSVFSQGEIDWEPWDCESSSPVFYVTSGPRQALIKYNTYWPANETRMVSKCIGSTCETIGQVSGGEHILEVTYDDPLIPGYWDTYEISLQVGGNSTEVTDPPMSVTTEPEPSLEASMSVVNSSPGEDSVYITTSSEAHQGQGWGEIFPFCTSHQIILDLEVFGGEDVVFRDTAICIPGEPTIFNTSFVYKGSYMELCTRVSMKRIDLAETFEPRTVTTADEVCMMAGSSATTIVEGSGESSQVLASPNPCRDILFLQSAVPIVWRVTNMLGSLVEAGQKKEINTGSWPSGMYFLEVEGTTRSITRIVRE